MNILYDFFLFPFKDGVSLSSPGCRVAVSIGQSDFDPREVPFSTYLVLGISVCHHVQLPKNSI